MCGQPQFTPAAFQEDGKKGMLVGMELRGGA